MHSAKDKVLDFIHQESPDFGAAIYAQARRCLLDLLGVAAGAGITQSSQILARYVMSQYGATSASRSKLLFMENYVSEAGAAMYGAGLIDSLDAHDGHALTKGHVGVVVLPILLAQQNIEKMSGQDFLSTLVIGYEIGTRAGISLHRTACDYHASGAWNGVAGAAVAARIKKLSRAQTYEALGIAEYSGPRNQMMRCIDFPSMVKDGSTWGGLAGSSAAQLAAEGFTGAPAISVFGDDVHDIWSDLGDRWTILEQYFKAYPVCRWAQPAVECVRQIKAKHDFSITDVVRVEVVTFHEAKRLNVKSPKDSDQAQYSTPFAVACAIRDGVISARAITSDFTDPRLLDLSDRVHTRESDEYNEKFPAERWAHVTIELESGQKLLSDPMIARGNPENALTDAEVEQKFFEFSSGAISAAQAQSIFDAVQALNSESTMESLLGMI